jgi:hypothetical protein
VNDPGKKRTNFRPARLSDGPHGIRAAMRLCRWLVLGAAGAGALVAARARGTEIPVRGLTEIVPDHQIRPGAA